MTQLLEQAIFEVRQLPEAAQDSIAQRILEEKAKLKELAAKARADHKADLTTPMPCPSRSSSSAAAKSRYEGYL